MNSILESARKAYSDLRLEHLEQELRDCSFHLLEGPPEETNAHREKRLARQLTLLPGIYLPILKDSPMEEVVNPAFCELVRELIQNTTTEERVKMFQEAQEKEEYWLECLLALSSMFVYYSRSSS